MDRHLHLSNSTIPGITYTCNIFIHLFTEKNFCSEHCIINIYKFNRDAEDAVNARDGYDYDGYRLRVEFPRGTGPSNYRSGRGSGRNSNRGPPTRRTNHRVTVTGK